MDWAELLFSYVAPIVLVIFIIVLVVRLYESIADYIWYRKYIRRRHK